MKAADLRHELVCDRLVFVELDPVCGERSLQKQAQRQLRQFRLQQTSDRLVTKREDLATLLLPFVILKRNANSPPFQYLIDD